MDKIGLLLLMFIAPLLVGGCSATSVIQPQFIEGQQSFVAIAPLDMEPVIRLERQQYLKSLLESELENKGYFILDNQTTEAVCGDAACNNRSELFSKYGVDSLVHFRIDDLQRTDFLLGFYNTIAGSIEFTDIHKNALVRVEDRKSERGGVLFDSGQVIQGIKEQFENQGDEAFNLLASRFIAQLMEPVPGADVPVQQSSASLQIVIDEVTMSAAGTTTVCATGTPGYTAFVKTAQLKSGLREIRPGKYCGIFSAYVFGPQVEVELVNNFGETTVAAQSIMTAPQCIISPSIGESMLPEIDLRCVQFAGSRKLKQACDAVVDCSQASTYLFAGSGVAGPYQRLGTLQSTGWQPRPQVIQGRNYLVVVVDQEGVGRIVQVPAPLPLQPVSDVSQTAGVNSQSEGAK